MYLDGVTIIMRMILDDVWPSAELLRKKEELMTAGYSKCDQFIQDFKTGRLATQVCVFNVTMQPPLPHTFPSRFLLLFQI